jgi:FKBP-type peptidyl-prolyl cis-trans isomerase SlyD
VKEILDETVKMDFNHPLAGEDLYFSGKVFHVREASEEELNQQSCGCGSSCGDGCEPEENVGGCGCGDGCCG